MLAVDDGVVSSSTTESFSLFAELPYWDSSHRLCSSRVCSCCCSVLLLISLS